MSRRIKLSKILITIILTGLIWVSADLALEDEYGVSNANLSVAKSVDPSLWVSFDGRTSVTLRKVVLRGSARRIADVRQRISEGAIALEFFFDPVREQMTRPGSYPLDLADFLKRTDKISQLGLTVASCDPNVAAVSVVELQKKTLNIKCLDQSQNLVKVASVEPAQISMYVPAEWSGEALVAKVTLTAREIEQAKVAPVQKIPFIEIAPGQVRQATETVRIATVPEQERLEEYTITNARIGFSLSANLQSKYKVELMDPDVVMGPVAIRATPEAKRAYEGMKYHLILEIDDGDKDVQAGEVRRELTYNFPEEFVRRDEIVLNQAKVQARFKLVPLETVPAAQN